MTSTLTFSEAERMIENFSSHEKFCSHLQIRNKEGVTVPYKISPAGLKLNRSIRKQESLGLPIRQVVLKASQVWMTSAASAEIFRRIPFFPGRRALVLADSEMHADLIFEYFRQYMDSYAEKPFGAEFQSAVKLPDLIKDTERWLRWANDSSALVGTAYNVDIGRSAPYNWALLSEAAFYRDLGTLMTGLMQRIPRSADSGVIVESTANGMGGDFYDLCQLAMDPRRATGWAFVFFGWWEHPENRLKAEPGFKLMRDELAELAKHNLHVDQIAWRRWMIETACEGKVDRFRQEHPADAQEAFQSSGRTIFDMAAVNRMRPIHAAPRGRLELVDAGMEKRIQFVQSEDGRGELVIFKQPRKGGRYCIGIDHAEGIDPQAKKGAGNSDPDYCSATVIDADTGEQVAAMKERYEPAPWAERIYWLGRYYNWAFLSGEAKAVGKAVLGNILTLQYPVELLYSRQRDPSDRRTPLLQDLWFDTQGGPSGNGRRAMLISGLDRAIRYGSIQLHDSETIQELRQFVRKPNGREEGIEHDDSVLSTALAVEGLPYAIKAFAYREESARDGNTQWKPVKYGQQAREVDDD